MLQGCLCKVSFLTQLYSGIICLKECFPLTYNLHDFKSIIYRHLLLTLVPSKGFPAYFNLFVLLFLVTHMELQEKKYKRLKHTMKDI